MKCKALARKNSKKRDVSLACLLQSKENPTVEMLYRQLKPDNPELSLGTVYRNLAITGLCDNCAKKVPTHMIKNIKRRILQ